MWYLAGGSVTDMGSHTPAQNKGVYELEVNRLQPNCMVSGRLGNDSVDFAVISSHLFGIPILFFVSLSVSLCSKSQRSDLIFATGRATEQTNHQQRNQENENSSY